MELISLPDCVLTVAAALSDNDRRRRGRAAGGDDHMASAVSNRGRRDGLKCERLGRRCQCSFATVGSRLPDRHGTHILDPVGDRVGDLVRAVGPFEAVGCNENLHCQASGFTQCGGMLRCAMATALSAHSAAIRARTFVVALPTCGSSTTLVRSASPGVRLGSCS